MLRRWLSDSYSQIDWKPHFIESRNDSQKKTEEHFGDDPERIEMYKKWLASRSQWVTDYQAKLKTRNLFEELHEKRDFIERDVLQEYEIVAGNALFETKRSPK